MSRLFSRELLGLYITEHPFEDYKGELSGICEFMIAQAEPGYCSTQVILAHYRLVHVHGFLLNGVESEVDNWAEDIKKLIG